MPTTSDVAISFDGVSKRYHYREAATLKEFLSSVVLRRKLLEEFYALRDVSFSIERGEAVGIVGGNGSGKSTILKLIAGISSPSTGRIGVSGHVSPLIELGTGFHPDLTGRENIFLSGAILGMSRQQIADCWDEIVDFAELGAFMETPVKHYSTGMFMRLGFAIAVHSDPDILLVDEVLAVGDQVFQEKCLNRIQQLKSNGVTIVMVSHVMPLIQHFCTRAIHIDHGRLVMDGPVAEVVANYVT